MYRGFNLIWNDDKEQQRLKLESYISEHGSPYSEENITNESENIKQIQKRYISKVNASKILLDGDKMEEDCFPTVDANIFLSHSHEDEPIALRIKFLLEKIYRQKVFVDSCVWKYCNDLLREIDDEYCRDNDELYNYQKRNNSTAVVHMMLSTALTRMMDKTECIFFLRKR